MKQEMKRISFIQLIGNHTLPCEILRINCTSDGCECDYFHSLLMQLSPNYTQKHAITFTNTELHPVIIVQITLLKHLLHSRILRWGQKIII